MMETNLLQIIIFQLLLLKGSSLTAQDNDYYTHYDEEYGEDDFDEEESGSGSGDSEEEVLVLPKFTSSIQNVTVEEGDSFNLSCSVDSLGKFVLMWKKDGQMIILNNQILNRNPRISIFVTDNGNTVMVQNVSSSDVGLYSCQVSAVKTVQQIHQVLLRDKNVGPNIVKSVTKFDTEKELWILTCESNQPGKIEWFLDGQQIEESENFVIKVAINSSTLMISKDAESNFLEKFECKISNKRGSDQAALNISSQKDKSILRNVDNPEIFTIQDEFITNEDFETSQLQNEISISSETLPSTEETFSSKTKHKEAQTDKGDYVRNSYETSKNNTLASKVEEVENSDATSNSVVNRKVTTNLIPQTVFSIHKNETSFFENEKSERRQSSYPYNLSGSIEVESQTLHATDAPLSDEKGDEDPPGTQQNMIKVESFKDFLTDNGNGGEFNANDILEINISETVSVDDSDLTLLVDVDMANYFLESSTEQIDHETTQEEISDKAKMTEENDHELNYESSTEIIQERVTETFDSEEFQNIRLITSEEPIIEEGSGPFLIFNELENENLLQVIKLENDDYDGYLPETSSSSTHQTQITSHTTSDHSSKYVLQWVIISPSIVSECVVQFRHETLESEESEWLYINAILKEDGPDTYIGKVTLEHLKPGSEYQVRILTVYEDRLEDLKQTFFFTTKDDEFSGDLETSGSGSGFIPAILDDASGDNYESGDNGLYNPTIEEVDSSIETSTVFEKKRISKPIQKNSKRGYESDSLIRTANLLLSIVCASVITLQIL